MLLYLSRGGTLLFCRVDYCAVLFIERLIQLQWSKPRIERSESDEMWKEPPDKHDRYHKWKGLPRYTCRERATRTDSCARSTAACPFSFVTLHSSLSSAHASRFTMICETRRTGHGAPGTGHRAQGTGHRACQCRPHGGSRTRTDDDQAIC